MRQVVIFVVSFLVWILLAWPFDAVSGQVQAQDLVAGVVVALLVAFVMRDVGHRDFRLWLNPARYFWFFVYIFVLAYYIVKANFDVAYRVLHPAMPIRPGIVKVRTSLKSAAAITALSNSITLTPGTLTVSASQDGNLYVHWINVRSADIEEATKHIVSRFEWFLKKIFE